MFGFLKHCFCLFRLATQPFSFHFLTSCMGGMSLFFFLFSTVFVGIGTDLYIVPKTRFGVIFLLWIRLDILMNIA
jgi:hypothetical protein